MTLRELINQLRDEAELVGDEELWVSMHGGFYPLNEVLMSLEEKRLILTVGTVGRRTP